MVTADAPQRLNLPSESRCRHLIALSCTLTLTALLCAVSATPVHAQNPTPGWEDGSVEVRPGSLTIKEGESFSYELRLTKQPTADGWWVRVHVDGAVRYDGEYDVDGDGQTDITWIPSVGWEFDRDNWDEWRTITVRARTADAQTVTFTHEVWDHTTNCPVHDVGRVTVYTNGGGGGDGGGGGGDGGDGGGDDGSDESNLPTLRVSDAVANEGSAAKFVVRLSSKSDQTVTAGYETRDDAAKSGSDYTATSGALIFRPGTTQLTIEVQTRDDDVVESDERFRIKLLHPDGATLEDAGAWGTILDNDGGGGSLPYLSIADAAPVTEGGTAEFEVTLSTPGEQAVTVAFATADGTASAGSDYSTTTGTLRFEGGDTSRRIRVSVLDDETLEETEGFTVVLSDPAGAGLGDGTAEGTILDDDQGKLPALDIRDAAPVAEGVAALFDVTLSARSEQTVTVAYATEDGTAIRGSDYTTTEGTLTFQPGTTRQTIEVPTLEDDIEESDEGFTVTLRDPEGATLGSGTGTGTIADTDGGGDLIGDGDGDGGSGGLPALSIGDAAVMEGETAEFVVTLTPVAGYAVTVGYATEDGTALEGSDYAGMTGTLRFDPGDTTRRVRIPVLEDEIREETERFTVELHSPAGAAMTDRIGEGTITDDDEGKLPALFISDAGPVAEGERALFRVTLSARTNQAVTVAYTTVDGTAAAELDYGSTQGTLRFEPGDTALTIAVATLIDELLESAEQFTVVLSEPVGATVARGTATGVITDGTDRLGVVNRTVLPELGRALAFTSVTCRFERPLAEPTAPDGTAGPIGRLSLSPALTSDGWTSPADQRERLSLERVLGNSSFQVASNDEEGTGRFAAWGCGDYRRLAGGGGNGGMTWNGEVFSVHVGADVRLGSDVRAGLSVSRSRGLFDYHAGAGEAGGAGAYDLRLIGLHPYLGWSVSPGIDVRGTIGHAWGELRVVDETLGGPLTSAATLDSGALEVSGRLLERGSTTLRLKGEGALARLGVAGHGSTFEPVTLDMRRLRVSTEAGYEHAFSSGASLTPWAELGLRHDGGDGETGSGLEVGGGLRYRNPEAGWTTEGYGRWLAVHRGTLREWGVGARIRFDPGASGRGPSVSLMPGWGDTASGVQRLWERGATDPTVPGAPGSRLDAQFGYGFAAFGGRGGLTPFGTVSLDRRYGRGYRVGSRLAMGRSADLSLEAARRERNAAAAVHAVFLRGVIRF